MVFTLGQRKQEFQSRLSGLVEGKLPITGESGKLYILFQSRISGLVEGKQPKSEIVQELKLVSVPNIGIS